VSCWNLVVDPLIIDDVDVLLAASIHPISHQISSVSMCLRTIATSVVCLSPQDQAPLQPQRPPPRLSRSWAACPWTSFRRPQPPLHRSMHTRFRRSRVKTRWHSSAQRRRRIHRCSRNSISQTSSRLLLRPPPTSTPMDSLLPPRQRGG
jgi:hypothetical protein